MDLIRFQGLNCYHECVLSIVNHFGLNYRASFAALWSETDFRYDPHRNAYLTKRMISNLELLGAKVESFDCFSKEDTDKNLAMFDEGEYMIIGMDAFYIPWNQFHRTFHGSHYFIAKNAETMICIDPTYGRQDGQISRLEVAEHIFDVCRISESVKRPLLTDVKDEAREVLATHQNTRQAVLSQIQACTAAEQERIIRLAKYIDAMINNRYLYQNYLTTQPYREDNLFMNSDYFFEWKAVKNGLYKAAVSANQNIISDICGHFNLLIDKETAMAEKIAGGV